MTYSRFSLLKSRSRKTLGDFRITTVSCSDLLQLTHNFLKGTIDMEVVKAKLFCPEIAGLFCRIAGLFCHDSRANLSLKPVCFGIAIS